MYGSHHEPKSGKSFHSLPSSRASYVLERLAFIPMSVDRGDIYTALDELRALSKYSVADLSLFHRWYCNYVNPRQSPALHGANIAQFAATFRNASRDNPTIQALFSRFQRPNGVADMLEVFAGMCMICNGTDREKLAFLFNLFDFAGNATLVEDEVSLLLESVAGAFSSFGLIVMPAQHNLEFASGWMFTNRQTGTARVVASFHDFQSWVAESPAARELLEILRCVPIVEAILRRFHSTVDRLLVDSFGPEQRTITVHEVKRKHRESRAISRYQDDIHVLIGPIVGLVEYSAVTILVEIDSPATISVNIYLASGHDCDFPLLPTEQHPLGLGYAREKPGRLFRTHELNLDARRPRSARISGLVPGSRYHILLAGVASDDCLARVGSFRTLHASHGCGAGAVLKRYHSHRQDRDSPHTPGLSLVAVGGNPDTFLGDKATGIATDHKANFPHPVGSNRPVVWKSVWESSVGPSRIDLIIHTGSQVAVASTMCDACVMLKRWHAVAVRSAVKSTQPPESWAECLSEVAGSVAHQNKVPLSLNPFSFCLELIRNVYRRQWNMLYTKECLAHCANLMLWGKGEMCLGGGHIENSPHAPLLRRASRHVFWEYQRQLWDPDCVRSWSSLSKAAPLRHTSIRRRDEGHFHCFGEVGLLFVDTEGTQYLANGDRSAGVPVISHEQYGAIAQCLGLGQSGRLATHLHCQSLLVVMSSRFEGECVHSASHHSYTLSPPGEADFSKLAGMLFRWRNSISENVDRSRQHRVVQIVAGANATGFAAEMFVRDQLSRASQINQVVLGYRNVFATSSSAGSGASMIHSSFAISGEKNDPDYPRYRRQTAHVRTCAVSSKSYALLRFIHGKKASISETMAAHNVEAPLAYHPVTVAACICIGPIIGTVTASTAVVLVEIDRDAVLLCRVRDVLNRHERIAVPLKHDSSAHAGRPFTFLARDLAPGRRYSVFVEGAVNSCARFGSFVTLDAGCHNTPSRLLLASLDCPRLQKSCAPRPQAVVRKPSQTTRTCWESIWQDQINARWHGADAMLRLGGQVWLDGIFEAEFISIIEAHRADGFVRLQEKSWRTARTAFIVSHHTAMPRNETIMTGGTSDMESDNETDTPNVCHPTEVHNGYQKLRSDLADLVRKAYRRAWNAPHLRCIMAHCAQLIIPGASDFFLGLYPWRTKCELYLFGPLLLAVCQQVQSEYQQQLWKMYPYQGSTLHQTGPARQDSSGRSMWKHSHCARSLCLGTRRNVMLLTLDLWSNRIRRETSNSAQTADGPRFARGMWEPDRSLIGHDQWAFLTRALQALEDGNKDTCMCSDEHGSSRKHPQVLNSGVVDTLLVAFDIPFTGRTPAEINQLDEARGARWARDDWSSHEAEFVRLINMLIAWKSRQQEIRDVWLLAGCGGVAPAGESIISCLRSGVRIRQAIIGPTSGIATGALPEREIHFGLEFVRTPVYRTFCRSYGILTIIPSTFVSSRTRSDGAPSTTTGSSMASIGTIRLDIVTQTDACRREAPHSTAERLPWWWVARTGWHSHQQQRLVGTSHAMPRPSENIAAMRSASVARHGSIFVKWARQRLWSAFNKEHSKDVDFLYRHIYLGVNKLADSVFYEDISHQISTIPPTTWQSSGSAQAVFKGVLAALSQQVSELRTYEDGITSQAIEVRRRHHSLVSTLQLCFGKCLRSERQKRELFYHIQGRISDCQSAIVLACIRAGYPAHRGGIAALRNELSERNIETSRRLQRRERQEVQYEQKKAEVLDVKRHADFVLNMEPGEVKEEKRQSPVHADDASGSKIATAVLAITNFVQKAGISKKKMRKAGAELADAATRILREQNVVRVQRGKVMLVNIADEVTDCFASVQAFFQDRYVDTSSIFHPVLLPELNVPGIITLCSISTSTNSALTPCTKPQYTGRLDELREAEEDKVREHRSKLSWLRDRVGLLLAVDRQVKTIEAERQVLDKELELRHREMREAVERRLATQSELAAGKVSMRSALAAFEQQLLSLEEQVHLGELLVSQKSRIEDAVKYLWSDYSNVVPRELKCALPDLCDSFVLAQCMDSACFDQRFTSETGKDEQLHEHAAHGLPPLHFFRCIVEVVTQCALVRVGLVLPVPSSASPSSVTPSSSLQYTSKDLR